MEKKKRVRSKKEEEDDINNNQGFTESKYEDNKRSKDDKVVKPKE